MIKIEPNSKMTHRNDTTIISRDILIVDDEISNLKLLSEYLGKAGYQVRPLEKPQLAINSALSKPPALILLDVRMPEMDGFEVCKRLKQDKRTSGIPIIFISELQDVKAKVRGFEVGGVDFISKPFQEKEVVTRVRTHMDLSKLQLRLEEVVANRTEKVLAREQRLCATFEQAAVGIAHISLKGCFIRINKKFCEIFGYSEDEMLALSFQGLELPNDLSTDLDYIQQLLKGEIETYSIDKRYHRRNGSTVWVSLTVSLVFEKGGGPNYFVLFIMDISDRKQTEEALRKSHDFLEHLTSAVPDAIFSVKMPERTINWVNDSFNVMDYEPEEYIGQHTKKYYANLDNYRAVGDLQRDALRRGDDMIRTEIMVLRKDGQVFPAEFTATFFREEGKLSRITAFVRDISDRKSAEENLAKSEAKYRGLVDNAIVGVFNTTLNGRFLFVNEAMARMFDFESLEDMIARGTLERWVDLKDRERMLAELNKHGKVTNFEMQAVTHTGRQIHVLFSAKQIGDNIFGMMMDISKRKEAEDKLNDYQARLKTLAAQLAISEEKDRHVIATHLHDQVGHALALARMQLDAAYQLSNEPEIKEQLTVVSDTLLQVLEDNQLLMLELGSPGLHGTGLPSAISDWLDGQIANHHNLRTQVIDNLPDGRLKTLGPDVGAILYRNVRELVVNVVKHAQAKRVTVRLEERDANVRIVVEDDGVGFDYGAARIMGNKTGGFGLFSIEELVADLGGNLKIVSKPGKGCSAILSMPLDTGIQQKRE